MTRVRAAIDELTQDGSNLVQATSDEANLKEIIVDKIGYALRHVLENAPLDKLDDSMFETLAGSSLSIDSTTLIGRVTLPTDLLRIIEARLSSWSHFPLPKPDTSEEALMQQDQYARGSWDRPVNILTHSGGHKVLEMYCAKTANDTLKCVFIRRPDVSGISTANMQTQVSVPSALEASLIYQVAGLTMVAFREDIAASLFAIAQRYLDPEVMSNE